MSHLVEACDWSAPRETAAPLSACTSYHSRVRKYKSAFVLPMLRIAAMRAFALPLGAQHSSRTLARPSKTPPIKTIRIFCSGCKTFLYRYHKGGKGSLVKCFEERIHTDNTAGDLHCPGCGREFARRTVIKGLPAHKIISGRVFHK